MNDLVVWLHDRLAPDAAFAARSAAVATGTACDAVIPSYDLHADAAEVRAVSGAGCRNVFANWAGNQAWMPVLLSVGCGASTQVCVFAASSVISRDTFFLRGPRFQLNKRDTTPRLTHTSATSIRPGVSQTNNVE